MSKWNWGIDSYSNKEDVFAKGRKANGGTPLWGEDNEPVLVIYESHGGGQMPNVVNKRLIESAPDLLEACHLGLMFAKAYRETMRQYEPKRLTDKINDNIKEIEQAIQRAEA